MGSKDGVEAGSTAQSQVENPTTGEAPIKHQATEHRKLQTRQDWNMRSTMREHQYYKWRE